MSCLEKAGPDEVTPKLTLAGRAKRLREQIYGITFTGKCDECRDDFESENKPEVELWVEKHNADNHDGDAA